MRDVRLAAEAVEDLFEIFNGSFNPVGLAQVAAAIDGTGEGDLVGGEFLLGGEDALFQEALFGKERGGGVGVWVGAIAAGQLDDGFLEGVGTAQLLELALHHAAAAAVGGEALNGAGEKQGHDADHKAEPEQQLVANPPLTGHAPTSLSAAASGGSPRRPRLPPWSGPDAPPCSSR
jgi:hypothetical protein